MNEDYLWDKTGEPDPEIQELEQVLSTFKYQARPLRIPKTPALGQRRFFASGLAVAASVLLTLLGLGLWVGLQRREQPARDAGVNASLANDNNKPQSDVPDIKKEAAVVPEEIRPPSPDKPHSYKTVAHKDSRDRLRRMATPARERAEAEKAKQQLFMALRLASTKLNLAQKRAQGTPNIIRNQHKVG